MADGVPLLFIRSLFVLSSAMMFAACQVSGSAGARCPKCVLLKNMSLKAKIEKVELSI